MNVNREVMGSTTHFCRILLLFVAVILIAVLSVYAAQNGGQRGPNNNDSQPVLNLAHAGQNNNQNGPNNNDSRPVLDLAKFTDVPALLAAIRKAKSDAAALPKSGADRPHIEKAIESLNAALSDSFTASNIDNLFQNVRQAVTSFETVKGPTAAARKIAGDLTEAIRVAVEKFLANVERAIPRLADTKTRENAMKDLAKSKEDYGRGVAAISTSRTAAINHFQQAMKRMVEYPLEALALTITYERIGGSDSETMLLSENFSIERRIPTEILFLKAPQTRVMLASGWSPTVSPNGKLVAIPTSEEEIRVYSDLGVIMRSYRIAGLRPNHDVLVNLFLTDNGQLAISTSIAGSFGPQSLYIPYSPDTWLSLVSKESRGHWAIVRDANLVSATFYDKVRIFSWDGIEISSMPIADVSALVAVGPWTYLGYGGHERKFKILGSQLEPLAEGMFSGTYGEEVIGTAEGFVFAALNNEIVRINPRTREILRIPARNEVLALLSFNSAVVTIEEDDQEERYHLRRYVDATLVEDQLLNVPFESGPSILTQKDGFIFLAQNIKVKIQ